MKKRMLIMLICVAVLFALVFAFKMLKKLQMYKGMMAMSQVTTVSAIKAEYSPWQPQMTFTSSLRAVEGVNVTTELAGMIQQIYFKPGSFVKKGDVLVQLNADADIAQLHALQSNANLAKITYNRNRAQYAIHAISKEQLDTNSSDLANKLAQVENQAAIVVKKTIRAPFTGRLGISAINPGQFLNPGDKIVTLQALDPLYADFYVPQQALVQIKTKQVVALTLDQFPKQVFKGIITTIDPIVDASTRNAEVEATVANADYQLLPGMFATAEITTGAPQQFLTLPQTAVSYNPYGDIVFIVKQSGKDAKGHPAFTAQQTFVVTGEKRGDQVVILSGIKAGDLIVTSGQLKLKNGSPIAINNSVIPANRAVSLLTER